PGPQNRDQELTLRVLAKKHVEISLGELIVSLNSSLSENGVLAERVKRRTFLRETTHEIEVLDMGIGVVLVSLIGVAKGCKRLMNLYFGLVMCFLAIQSMEFMSGSDSWEKAYQTDQDLLQDIQIELCGVLLLTILFKYLATMDQDEAENADEESPFFKCEKQIEEARTPPFAGQSRHWQGLPNKFYISHKKSFLQISDQASPLLTAFTPLDSQTPPTHFSPMPGTTMASDSGIKTPPHCFCFKPAIQVYTENTENDDLVYECHYTNAGLWLEHRGPFLQQGHESNPSAKPSTSTSPRSPPALLQSPVLNTVKDQHPHPRTIPSKNKEALQDVTDALQGLVNSIGRNHLPYKPPTQPLSRPSNRRQMIVCGFHMHACLWEHFKLLVVDHKLAQSSNTRRALQDTLLARQHHEIVLRCRDHHSQLLDLAEKSRCAANIKTINRWLNNGNKVMNGTSSPLGGAPICFCGTRMKLSSTHHGEMLNIAYFCARRLVDAKGGCSRVMKAEKWVQWQPLDPIHPLSSVQATTIMSNAIETEDDAGTDVDDPISHTTGKTTRYIETEISDSDPEEFETDRSITPVTEPGFDSEGLWDRCVNMESSSRELRTLEVPVGLTVVEGRIERANSKANHSGAEDSNNIRTESRIEQNTSVWSGQQGRTLNETGHRQDAERDSHLVQR
ncbi:hypothetical protein BGZ65_007027, partial [Modicella reniformis]